MNISIPVEERYKRKEECVREARLLVARGLDMSVDDCAKEIYAHARIYWEADSLRSSLPKYPKVLDWLAEHANPIDLADGGDLPSRRIVYDLIWRCG